MVLPADESDGGQTGWKSVDEIVNVPSGLTKLHFHVSDVGDSLVDSGVLIDNVVDPLVDGYIEVVTSETSTPSTDYLLAFARAIGGIDDDDIEDSDENERDLASNTCPTTRPNGLAGRAPFRRVNTDSDHEVSLEAIRESLVVVKEFMENHINAFGNAINHNEIKAQLDTLLAKVDAFINNGGGISASLRNEIETVLDSICKENSVIFCHHNHDEE